MIGQTLVNFVRKNFYVVFVTVSCSLAFTSVGGALSWPSPSLVKLREPDSPIHLTTSEESWIGSFLAIGGVCIAIPYTYLFNTTGRKWLIIVAAVFHTAGWLPIIFATEVVHIYIGRFILGAALAPSYGSVPVYLAEVVHKDVRGISVACLIIAQSCGALLQYGIAPLVSFQINSIVSMIIPLLFLLTSIFIPESPFYLLRINEEKRAQVTLMKLRGARNIDEIQEEYDDMKNFLDESPPMSCGEIFKELSLSKSIKAILIVVISMFAQQFSGIGAIVVYLETIFIDIETSIASNVAVLLSECVADISTICSFFFIDRVGRKPLLFVAAIVCIIADLLVGFYFYGKEIGTLTASSAWMGVLGIFLVQAAYAVGLGSVPILLMSEIVSFNLKGWVAGLFLIIQGVFNAVSIKIFQIVNDSIGNYYSYWLFAVCVFFSVGFLMFYMPETKGKTFQEIQDIMSKKKTDQEIQLSSTGDKCETTSTKSSNKVNPVDKQSQIV